MGFFSQSKLFRQLYKTFVSDFGGLLKREKVWLEIIPLKVVKIAGLFLKPHVFALSGTKGLFTYKKDVLHFPSPRLSFLPSWLSSVPVL